MRNKTYIKTHIALLSAALFAVLLSACGAAGNEAGAVGNGTEPSASRKEDVQMGVEKETSALSSADPAINTLLTVDAPGTLEGRNEYAVIDYSNTADGYVMVQYTASTQTRLKTQVAGPTSTYTYNLSPGVWAAFPLSDGNGIYKITVLENVEGNKYATMLSTDFTADMKDEFAPFLRPNQYVNFEIAPNTIAKAAELTESCKDALEKVELVYNFVVDTISYDEKLAATVQSGYLPDLDAVLESKKGICFDYAALMTGMLRSCGVPCKLVVGYAGEIYHAWISVWVEGTGWVDGVVYFDGVSWQRMDPTFASGSATKKSAAKYIGDGDNYSAKYFY